jgi:hypothetical protein
MAGASRFLTPMALLAAVSLAAPSAVRGQGNLNVYCSVQAEWCQAVANEFQRQTGIRVALTLKGSGETLAQVTAEAANPKGDVWFGGTGDPHLAAAEQNLTVGYKSPNLDKLHDWARRQAEQSGFKTVGIYAGALGFGYNPELLQKKKLAAPACWKDLIKPDYKDEIQVANPNSSGTAYTAVATIVQIFGEEEAFRYLRQLHRNVNQYTRSGVGPIKAVARRDVGQHQLHARRRHRGARRLPRQDPGAVRGHRLRGRLAQHHQGLAQPGGRPEVRRLGADAAGAEARGRGQAVPGALEPGGSAAARGAAVRRHQADQLRLREVRRERRA